MSDVLSSPEYSSAPVLDLLKTRASGLSLATEAAVTVLRVDQIIMSKPAGGPKGPPPNAGADMD